MRLSRDLLMRGITYKLQERPLGGLSKSIIRKLECLNLDSEASDAQKPAPPISLKAGTRLVREWRGVTHTVLVHAGGFEWNGPANRLERQWLFSASRTWATTSGRDKQDVEHSGELTLPPCVRCEAVAVSKRGTTAANSSRSNWWTPKKAKSKR